MTRSLHLDLVFCCASGDVHFKWTGLFSQDVFIKGHVKKRESDHAYPFILLFPLFPFLLNLIYAYVGDTFETVADRNDLLVDTFNRRLEVSATKRKFYCR